MALRPADANRGIVVDRRDVLSAFLLAAGGQMAAATLLQPARTYEKPSRWMTDAFQTTQPLSKVVAEGEDFSEQELYKFQRRMRKIADSSGSSEMQHIAEAMGYNLNCMSSDICQRNSFGTASGYD